MVATKIGTIHKDHTTTEDTQDDDIEQLKEMEQPSGCEGTNTAKCAAKISSCRIGKVRRKTQVLQATRKTATDNAEIITRANSKAHAYPNPDVKTEMTIAQPKMHQEENQPTTTVDTKSTAGNFNDSAKEIRYKAKDSTKNSANKETGEVFGYPVPLAHGEKIKRKKLKASKAGKARKENPAYWKAKEVNADREINRARAYLEQMEAKKNHAKKRLESIQAKEKKSANVDQHGKGKAPAMSNTIRAMIGLDDESDEPEDMLMGQSTPDTIGEADKAGRSSKAETQAAFLFEEGNCAENQKTANTEIQKVTSTLETIQSTLSKLTETMISMKERDEESKARMSNVIASGFDQVNANLKHIANAAYQMKREKHDVKERQEGKNHRREASLSDDDLNIMVTRAEAKLEEILSVRKSASILESITPETKRKFQEQTNELVTEMVPRLQAALWEMKEFNDMRTSLTINPAVNKLILKYADMRPWYEPVFSGIGNKGHYEVVPDGVEHWIRHTYWKDGETRSQHYLFVDPEEFWPRTAFDRRVKEHRPSNNEDYGWCESVDFVKPKEQGATRDTRTRPFSSPEAKEYDLRIKAVWDAFDSGNLKPIPGVSQDKPFTHELAAKLIVDGHLGGTPWRDWLKSEESNGMPAKRMEL